MNLQTRLTAITLLSISCLAQQSIDQFQNLDQVARRGFTPTGSYSVSELETINTTNGNLIYNIPLVSLPAGNGGLKAGISLIYNSQIYDTGLSWYDKLPNHDKLLKQTMQGSSSGGWRYGFNVSFERANDRPTPDGGYSFSCNDPEGYHHYRYQLVLPDGSTHQLHLQGYGDNLGYTNVDLDNFQEFVCGNGSQFPQIQQINTPVRMFTSDGTFIRVVMTKGSNPSLNAWEATMPDGTRYLGNGGSTTQIIDRNGNTITVAYLTYPLIATLLIDSFGRVNTLYYTTSNSDIVAQRGVKATEDIVWTVNWEIISTTGGIGYVGTAQGDAFDAGFGGRMVTNLSMSRQNVANPNVVTDEIQYDFAYDTAYGGWGELNNVKFRRKNSSTNLYEVSYTYSEAQHQRQFFDLLNNPIQRKVLSFNDEYDGSTTANSQTWNYLFSKTQSTITNPDGGKTITDFFDRGSAGDPLRGLAWRVTDPNNNRTERYWATNAPYIVVPTLFWLAGDSLNPYVKHEYRILYSSPTNAVKFAAKSFILDKNGNTTETREFDWQACGSATNGTCASIPRQTPNEFPALNSTLASTTPTRRTTTSFNYPTLLAEDPVTNSATGYWNSASNKILRAPSISTVYNAGAMNAKTEFYYDEITTLGTHTNGNVTETKKYVTAAATVSTKQTYTGTGNVSTITDPNNNVTTLIYDDISCSAGSSPITAKGPYPNKRSIDVGGVTRSSSYTYDCYSGVPLTETDPNSVVVKDVNYDTFGRPTNITEPQQVTSITYDDPGRNVTTTKDLNSKSDGLLSTLVHYDGLGREALRTMSNDDATKTTKIQKRYCYGGPSELASNPCHGLSGHFELVSNPYTASVSISETDTTAGWTLTSLDTSGRIKTTASYGGAVPPSPWNALVNNVPTSNTNTLASTGTTYSLEAVTVSDPASKVRTTYTDGLGRLSSVEEGSGSTLTTTYAYNALNNLLNVNQGNQTRTFTYDFLGRLLSAKNPEHFNWNSTTHTADLTTTTYEYDGNGNLTMKTDGRSTITNLGPYDAWNRNTKKTYSGPAGAPSVTYCYDGKTYGGTVGTCNNGAITNSIGRLTQVYTDGSFTSYNSFDTQGRVLTSTQQTLVDGVNRSYPFTYTYYPTGRMQSITYPSATKVSYTQTNAGRVSYVKKGETTSADNYANVTTYSAHGAPTSVTMGNQVIEGRGYNGLLQLTSVTATKSGSQLLGLGFGYPSSSNNGNLSSQTITVGGSTFTQNYTYDALNRLSTASETTGWNQGYVYDRYGNRAVLVGTINNITYYVPNSAETPKVAAESEVAAQFTNNRWSQHSGSGFTEVEATHEDGTGNITALGTKTFGYDAENRMITSGGGSTTYTYDGDGRRVIKKTGNTSTVFVYDATGRLSAEYGSALGCGRCYFTADHLGSTRMVTDASGGVFSRYDYLPFGEQLLAPSFSRTTAQKYVDGSSDANTLRFTGKERDAETGLDYFGARYFSGAQGRFTTIDPEYASASLFDPQRWNAYSCAVNNPLKFVDPNGESPTLVTAAIGAGIGAVGGAGFNLVSQLISSGGDFNQVDYRQVGSSALGGAVSGGLAGLTLGVGTAFVGIGEAALANGAANVIGGIVTRETNGLLGVQPSANSSESLSVAVDFSMGAGGGVYGVRTANVRAPLPNVRKELELIANSSRRSLRAEKATAFIQSSNRQQIKNTVVGSSFGTAMTNFFSDFFFRAANVFNPQSVQAKKKDYETDITIKYDLPQ